MKYWRRRMLIATWVLLSCMAAPGTTGTNEQPIKVYPNAYPVQVPKRRSIVVTIDISSNKVPMPKEWQVYIKKLCAEYKVPYDEVLAVLTVENPRFKPDVISRTNDYGLMQINKTNHESLRKTLGISDFLDPYDNLKAGIYVLSKLQSLPPHERYMSYNMGVRRMKKTVSRGYTYTSYSSKVYKELMAIRNGKYKEEVVVDVQ